MTSIRIEKKGLLSYSLNKLLIEVKTSDKAALSVT